MLSSGLLSASAENSPKSPAPYSYKALFGEGATTPLQAGDGAFITKVANENPGYELDPLSAKLLPEADSSVRAFAVRSGKGVACLAMQFTTKNGPIGGGYGAACPSDGSGSIDFISPGGSFGLVPDSVKSVNFVMPDGTARSTEVQGNVWIAPLEAARATFNENGTLRDSQLMPEASLAKDTHYRGGGVSSGDDFPSAQTP
jgi:hypothetical protein